MLDLWRESLREPALIYVQNNKGADQPARPRRLISAFIVRCNSLFFSTKKRLTTLNGEQNDTWNLLVSHRICHFRALQPFDIFISEVDIHDSGYLLLILSEIKCCEV